MKKILISTLVLFAILLNSCSDDGGTTPTPSVQSPSDMMIPLVVGATWTYYPNTTVKISDSRTLVKDGVKYTLYSINNKFGNSNKIEVYAIKSGDYSKIYHGVLYEKGYSPTDTDDSFILYWYEYPTEPTLSKYYTVEELKQNFDACWYKSADTTISGISFKNVYKFINPRNDETYGRYLETQYYSKGYGLIALSHTDHDVKRNPLYAPLLNYSIPGKK